MLKKTALTSLAVIAAAVLGVQFIILPSGEKPLINDLSANIPIASTLEVNSSMLGNCTSAIYRTNYKPLRAGESSHSSRFEPWQETPIPVSLKDGTSLKTRLIYASCEFTPQSQQQFSAALDSPGSLYSYSTRLDAFLLLQPETGTLFHIRQGK